MSYEPVSYGSLKDLKKGKGHGRGGVPPPPASSYTSNYDTQPAQSTHHYVPPPPPGRGHLGRVEQPPTRYVNPSERREGQAAPEYHRKAPATATGSGGDEEQQSSGSSAGGARAWTAGVQAKASQGWDSVNDASKRDKVSIREKKKKASRKNKRRRRMGVDSDAGRC